MPRGPEAKIQDAVIRYARLRGMWAAKFDSPSGGVPDYVLSSPASGVFFIEFKAPGKKPRPDQLIVHAHMTSAGGRVYTVSSAARGKALVDDMVDFGVTKYPQSGEK